VARDRSEVSYGGAEGRVILSPDDLFTGRRTSITLKAVDERDVRPNHEEVTCLILSKSSRRRS
jgi:hypothetical protein